MPSEERLQILDMIAKGKITAQEGVDLLRAVDEEVDLEEIAADGISAAALPPAADATASVEPALEIEATPSIPAADTAVPPPPGSQAIPTIAEDLPEAPSFDPRAKKWRGWWRIPLWIGVVATILMGFLLYSIYNAAGFNFWFACAWFPFMLSVAIVALAWASRSAHWVHIRVHQAAGERPQNIAISFPVPFGLMGWFLRTFRSKIPNMQGVDPEEMILALNHVSPEKPFYVEVNEEGGEHVEVYIG